MKTIEIHPGQTLYIDTILVHTEKTHPEQDTNKQTKTNKQKLR